jgi:hypothetical protein
MRKTAVALVLGFALVAATARAARIADVEFPDRITIDGKSLALNGVGLRTKLVFKVYAGALYAEKTSADATTLIRSDQAKRMVLHFIHDAVDRGKLVDAWKEGFEENSKGSMALLRPSIDKFNSWMDDVKKGDRIEVTYLPGKGTSVSVKGQEKGTIEGKEFADAVFAIWLGQHPAHEGLKKGLLGGH